MALVTQAEALAFLQLSADDAYGAVNTVRLAADKAIKSYCNRSLELATYRERFASDAGHVFMLRETPVTDILQVGAGTLAVMTVTSTNAVTSGTATAGVLEDGLVLRRNGTQASATLTFAANTTVTALAAAVNAIGDGWVAAVTEGYGSYPTSLMLQRAAVSCIASDTVDINVPGTPLDGYQVEWTTGKLQLLPGFLTSTAFPQGLDEGSRMGYFNRGFYDLYVTYRGGYSTVPDDLKYAVLSVIALNYGHVTQGTIGVKTYSIGGISKSFEGIGRSEWPNEVKFVLDQYRNPAL